MGDGRQETGCGKQGDRKQETGDMRREMGDGRQETENRKQERLETENGRIQPFFPNRRAEFNRFLKIDRGKTGSAADATIFALPSVSILLL